MPDPTLLRRAWLARVAAGALFAGMPGGSRAASTPMLRPGPGFHLQPLDAASQRRGFRLHDTRGRLRTPAAFRQQVLVLFFGFLSCPAICPTTMLELAAARRALGRQQARVTIAFATLDPERDTPAALEAWLAQFGQGHLGLHDTPSAVATAAAGLNLSYRRVPGAHPRSYTIDHGVQAYVFDPAARLRLLWRPGPDPQETADDFRQLLAGV